MSWHPVGLSDLVSRIARDLLECSPEQREFLARRRITPTKWHLPRWGDEGGGLFPGATVPLAPFDLCGPDPRSIP